MILVANQTGNMSSSSTWDSTITPGTIHATTNVSITTAGKDSTTFTAPNTTNAATGVWVYAASYPSSGRDWTATLVESGVATAAVATITQTDMPTTVGWIYFRLPTPYTFTTTGAGAYKWNFKSTTANSGSMAADNTSTSLVFPLTTYDAHSAPTTSDQIWIGPHNCTGSAITVTVDGTTLDIRGSSTSGAATGPAVARQTTFGILVGGSLTDSLAILKWDTSASATLTSRGAAHVRDGGELQMGTSGTPYPSSYIATWTIANQSGTAYPICVYGGGKASFCGASKTYYDTTFSSGTGVAASPLVVADAVDWSVGDRIAVCASSNNATNYNETEYKYIITKNSSTSYVLSDTSGGSEAAFTYTHTNAKIVNLTRNVIVQPTTQIIQNIQTACASSGDFVCSWAYFKSFGSSGGTAAYATSAIYGLAIGMLGGTAVPASYGAVDYCVFDTIVTYGLINRSNIAQTYTGNIFCASGTSSNGATSAGLVTDGVGHTFVNHYFIDCQRQAIEYAGVNCTFTTPNIIACNKSATADNGGLYLSKGAPITVTGANIHCTRIAGIMCNTTTNSTITNSNIGTKGYNEADVGVVSSSANKLLLTNCNLGSSTTVTGYLNGAVGATLIAFDKFNQTANDHRWYTEYGSARSTGASLGDTTVRTASTLNIRVAPENSSTGFSWTYLVPAIPGRAVYALGFIRRNTTFSTSACTVELFLPGSMSADATQTMATTADTYLPYTIAANYSGTEPLYATVKITGKTATAGAYLYIADIYNGTNSITNLNTWYQGQPSAIMFEQLGDASAVWAVLTSTSTTTGTFGSLVQKLLQLPQFMALK